MERVCDKKQVYAGCNIIVVYFMSRQADNFFFISNNVINLETSKGKYSAAGQDNTSTPTYQCCFNYKQLNFITETIVCVFSRLQIEFYFILFFENSKTLSQSYI